MKLCFLLILSLFLTGCGQQETASPAASPSLIPNYYYVQEDGRAICQVTVEDYFTLTTEPDENGCTDYLVLQCTNEDIYAQYIPPTGDFWLSEGTILLWPFFRYL